MKRHRTGRLAVIPLALGLALLAGLPLSARSARVVPAQPAMPRRVSSTVSSIPRKTPDPSKQQGSFQRQLQFDRITTADGLSFPVVRDILQDQRGFLWFTTDSGLNRYDGYDFTVYREELGDPTTIRFDDVRVVYEDSGGTLWVGGGGGLDRFDRSTETFAHVDTRGQVYTIYEDSAGTLWAGFWHGVYGYNRATTEIIHSDQPDPDLPADWSARTHSAVQAIYEDRDGTLWVGTVAGLYRLDRTTGVFAAYRHDPQDPTSLSDDVVTAIYEDRQGNLWIGTTRGLNQLDRASGAFRHYRHDPEDLGSLSDDTVLSILEDSAGTLWLGTTSGLDRFDRSQDRFLHYRHDPEDPRSLSGDVITSLLEDRAGVLWVGTTDGVSKSNRREDQFTRYGEHRDLPAEPSYSLDVSDLLEDPQPAILSDSRIVALEEDGDGVLWIGTHNGGLNRLDRQSGLLTVYRHDPADPATLSSDHVEAIFEDHEGVLWVGAASGWLEQLDPQAEAFTHYRNLGAGVRAIAEDPAGDLWIGTGGEGLYRLDRNRLTLEHHPQFWRDPDHWWRYGTLSSHVISALLVDRAGVLWAGTTYGGINLWGVVEDRFTHLRHDPDDPTSLSHEQVLSVFEDSVEGSVWIGTGGGGLNRHDRAAKSFAHYTESDGLSSDIVGCILADEAGFLWLGTVKGLSRFDPGTQTFRNFDMQDGIGVLSAGQVAPGACLRSQTGEMLFGGSDGLYAFRPGQIQGNLQPPPVAITALKVSNETVHRDLSAGTHIQLPYEDNFLSFEFAALDYTTPEKNQYTYRLEGLDRDWVYAGTRRYADYPDLRPGDYVFQVKGSNSDGVWNEDGAAIRITVEPPLWQTWPFRGAVALVVVLGAVGVYRQRVRSVEARSRELERQVEERTREIKRLSEQAQELAVVAERQRLARDLHDAVSQTLFSASLIAETLPELWRNDPEQGERLLEKLQQLSRGAQAEMRALLMELRPAALAEASMRDLLRQLGQAVTGREGIPVAVTVDEACESHDRELPTDVHVALYRIAQEALNNVVKHAQASRVAVSLECSPSSDSPGTGYADGGKQGWEVRLRIRDDGLGFNPGSVSGERLGIGIMHERAASIGARLAVESEPGWGTQVTVVWPSDDGQRTKDDG